MADYEITYTTDAEMAEEARAQLHADVDAQIRDLGGATSYASSAVPRRLFFPIKKQRAAGLRMVQIELPAEKVQEIRAFLKKAPGLLRFSILNTPRRPEVPQAITDLLQQKRGRGGSAPARKPMRKPAAPVTMEAVEKGIEKALEEQVK